MLRGSSRHDGIPNKQSAKDPDRDRQREQQRKERAQMLPDDKEVHAVSQDLFNAPVKVKPSIEDSTSLQIRNSLGNFEPIRRLMESPGVPQTQQAYLLGTERGGPYPITGSSASVLQHRSSSNLINHHGVGVGDLLPPPPYRPPPTNSASASFPHPPESLNPSTKSHYQPQARSSSSNLYHTSNSHHQQQHPTSGGGSSSNNINSSLNSSSNTNYSSLSSSSLPNNSSSSGFRVASSNNQHQIIPQSSLPISKVPHTTNQPPQLNNTLFNSSTSTASSSINPPTAPLGGGNNPSTNFLTSSTSGPILSSGRSPNFNNPVKSSSSKLSTSSSSASFSGGGGGTSFNEGGGGHSGIVGGQSVDVKLEVSGHSSVGGSGGIGPLPEPFSTVFNNNEQQPQAFNNNSGRDAKCNKNVFPNKRPAPERADSQIELDTILREMTVIPPLTAIHTPVKESNKRLPPRRSSKSEDKIVQSIIDSGMAKIPSPLPRMESSAESSSSYETDSDSESEDSASSASHVGGENKADNLSSSNPPPTTGSPTTKWNLSSFLKNENTLVGKQGAAKSPKDGKSNSFSSLDSSDPIGVDEFGMPILHDRIDNVTSSTVPNKIQPPSPPEPPSAPLETRAKLAARTTRGAASNSRAEIAKLVVPPPAPPPPSTTISPKVVIQSQSKEKISSLSASSSEDDEPPVKQPSKRKTTSGAANNKTSQSVVDNKKGSTSTTSGATAAKRPRVSGQQTSTTNTRQHPTNKSDGDSSPENKLGKGSKNGQDKNKSDTIRKLFRRGGNKASSATKVQSPNLESGESTTTTSSNNKSLHNITLPNVTPTGKSGSNNNRVSGKGNPSSAAAAAAAAAAAHNGDLSNQVTFSDKVKKEGSSSSKDKSTASQSLASKKHSKSSVPKSTPSPELSANIINARLKDDHGGKSHGASNSSSSSSSSSLIVRIPLDKLRRKPPVATNNSSFPAVPASIVSPSLLLSQVKTEKVDLPQEKIGKGGGGKSAAASATSASSTATTDSYRVPKNSQNSSRVGSSSDPTISVIESVVSQQDRRDAMCSDPERLSPLNRSKKSRPKKRSRASPKKTKPKREPPDSHTKLEGDLTDGEVSSANVLGYAPCDSITRTPPIEPDVVQAPDSSLNPPHLPSPFVPPQVQYFSYFQKNDIKDDLFSRDQESYLEEAKKLKHSADQERTSAAQSSMYLEAGLYFILTGIIMERDSAGNSNASYTMYRDTLTLIQYIGTRWRNARSSGPSDIHNLEAKIITLSMRCQALLFCKLFRMKMKETREMVGHMHDYFTKAGVREPLLVSNSPQLSTPSPHSPTSSPAGSSGVLAHTPSPHHQQNHMLPIPRTLYNQIQKQCGNTYNCIMAHDTWEQADTFVTRYRLEDFFIGIDRHLGPLTLHSTLVDLVRYVRHGLQLINGS